MARATMGPVPELIEVERYRRLAERAVGRTIAAVHADDEWFCKGTTTSDALRATLPGRRFVRTCRRGKLLVLVTDRDVGLGLRFGMTGRLLVDGSPGVEDLGHASVREEPRWDRFALDFDDGGSLVVRDPRRLGGVELAPDVARLGPDAATIDAGALAVALGEASAPLKARLLDQARLAGLGNLLVDEVLWRAGLAPMRAAGSVDAADVAALAGVICDTIVELDARGGSHTGDLFGQRRADGACPIDGASLRRDAVGGRTTFWCPAHQRAR